MGNLYLIELKLGNVGFVSVRSDRSDEEEKSE